MRGKKISRLPVFLALVFLGVAVFFVWHRVLDQALIQEGPTYFVEPYLSIFPSGGFVELVSRHDAFPLIFFYMVRDIFKDSMQSYMWVLIIGSGFVTFSLFALVKKITGSVLAGLASSLIFTSNYAGSFEILGQGYYQWFIQRVPNFGLAVVGFIFLVNFLEKRKWRDYALSFFCYSLAVFLARYTIHILPLFVIHILFNSRFNLKLFVLRAAPFIVVSYFFLTAQSLVSTGGFTDFIWKTAEVIPVVIFKLAQITIPFIYLLPTYAVHGAINALAPFVFIAYPLSAFIVIRKNKHFLGIILTLLLSIPLSIYFSIYLNSGFLSFSESSRYLYFTSILASVYWGIVICAVSKKSKIFSYLSTAFIIAWFFYNNGIISKAFDKWQAKHTPVLSTIYYLSNNKNNISPGTIVVVPEEVGYYGAGMLQYFYKSNDLRFVPNIPNEIRGFQKKREENTMILMYDSSLGTVLRSN